MVTLHEVITFLVSMQISISSLQTHNVNRCGRSRHLARKLSLRRKLADDRLEAFYDNPNALRDYFRDIGRMVLAAEGRKANDSHADCYQYFCVPEYGTAN